MVACTYDTNHRVPPDKLEKHEKRCFLKSQGYAEEDRLLPSPFAPDITTLVTLSADNIEEIISKASHSQPLFRTGPGCSGHQPLTLERLQATYTSDERNAIHAAVVNQVPSCHDLSDLALLSSKSDIDKESKPKSKLEILAELRDMRRRRTKYRVAAKTRNYSDVLRDVISTQMELYSQANNPIEQTNVRSNYLDAVNEEKDDKALDKATISHCDNTTNRRYPNEGFTPVSIKDNICSISMYSTHREEDKTRKRRYNDSGYDHYSTKYSKTHERGEAASSTSNQYEGNVHYNSKSKRKSGEDSDYTRTNRKKYKHTDDYESRNSDREREFNHSKKSRSERSSSYISKKEIKDSHYKYNKLKEKYHKYERHTTNRERTELPHQSKDGIDRHNRYNYKQKHHEKIKEEEDYCYKNDNYYSNEVKEILNSKSKSQKCDERSIIESNNVRKENSVKRNRIVMEDNGNKYSSESADSQNKYQISEMFHSKQKSTSKKDNLKNKDKTNISIYQQQEYREKTIQKIKVENNVYEPSLDTNESMQEYNKEKYENNYIKYKKDNK